MLNIFLPAHAPDVAYANASKGVNNRVRRVIFNVASEYQFPSRFLSWELFAMMLAYADRGASPRCSRSSQ